MVFVRHFERIRREVPVVIESSDERSRIGYDVIAPCRIVIEFRNDLLIPPTVTKCIDATHFHGIDRLIDCFRRFRLADEIRVQIRIVQGCKQCGCFSFRSTASQAIAAPFRVADV